MRTRTGPNGPADRHVKEIKRKTRRKFSAEEKIRIVLDGLRGESSLSELCRREGIAESLYYNWSKDFMEAGKKRLAADTARQATSSEVIGLKREARYLKEVVAEQTLELRLLKKRREYPKLCVWGLTHAVFNPATFPVHGNLDIGILQRLRPFKACELAALVTVHDLRFAICGDGIFSGPQRKTWHPYYLISARTKPCGCTSPKSPPDTETRAAWGCT